MTSTGFAGGCVFNMLGKLPHDQLHHRQTEPQMPDQRIDGKANEQAAVAPAFDGDNTLLFLHCGMEDSQLPIDLQIKNTELQDVEPDKQHEQSVS